MGVQRAETIVIGIGELAVATGGVVATFALGSCVGVVLLDAVHGMAGLAHIMLPEMRTGARLARPAMYAGGAVDALVAAMVLRGSAAPDLQAVVVGGANVLGMRLDVGHENVLRTLEALDRHTIPLVGRETGGRDARTVHVHVPTGRVRIQSPGRRDRCLP
jgi:chemotaxis protein CheD